MNKCIAVFGAGLSGQSVANLAKSEGHSVTVFDETVGKKNDFSESDISCFDDFIFSPGFSKSIRGESCFLKRILFMEAWICCRAMAGEDFWRYRNEWENNGDSLARSCLGHRVEAYVAGNIGVPLSELVNFCQS